VNALLDLVCVRLCDQCPEVYVEFDQLIHAVGKAEGKRTVGRLWCRWEHNVKVNRAAVCEMDLSGLGHGQLAVR